MELMKNLTIRNAKLIARNFSGRKTNYNAEGMRSFCVLIDDQNQAQALAAAGWHVRQLNKRRPEDNDCWSLSVKVGYHDSRYIPSVKRFENGTSERLTEETIGVLDSDIITQADVVLRPKYWEANGKSGYAAYLQTLYCVVEDEWDPNNRHGNLVNLNASIIFRNFSGAKSKFNRNGDRSFALVIDNAEVAAKLLEDGWKLKEHVNERDTQEPPYWTLSVGLSFDNFAPVIEYYTDGNCVLLDGSTVGELDSARFDHVDVIIRPYHWTMNGNSGVKAYLKRMRAYAKKDEFADEYAQYETAVQTQSTDETAPW